MYRLLFSSALFLLTAGALTGNWPHWRGPTGNGISPDAKPPVEWSDTKNVKWKVALGGLGSSTPIVLGDRIYVTTAVDTGKTAPAGEDNRPEQQRSANPKGAPPQAIYRFDVIALDRADGSEVWRTAVSEQ